jgi:hypothetical protein
MSTGRLKMIEEILHKIAERQEKRDKELDRVSKEIDKLLKSQEKTDKEIDKLLKSQEKTDKEIDKLLKSQEKTDKEIARVDKGIDKLRKVVNKTSKDLGGAVCRTAEGLVGGCIKELFEKEGFDVEVQHRVRPREKKRRDIIEVDLLCPGELNGKDKVEKIVLVGEVKNHLTIEDITDFFSKLPYFKSYFPQYKNRKIYGLVAGLFVSEKTAWFANKKGLYVLVPSGNTMKIKSPSRLRAW